jgi:AAA domain
MSLRIVENGHQLFRLKATGLTIDISHVRWLRGEMLRGHVELRRGKAVLLRTEHDFNSLTDRERLVQQIARYYPDETEVSQVSIEINALAAQIVAAHTTVTEPVWLHEVSPAKDERVIFVDEFPILTSHPSIIFGDGGTGKSLLTLWLVGRLAQEGVRVLWLDWELEGSDHRERLAELFGDDLPENIAYYRCEASIGTLAEQLRKTVEDLGIELVVVDSAAFAIEGDPEKADAARTFFQALRSLGRVGSIVIAHETKNSDHTKPFGSAFWHNGARLTWYIAAKDRTSKNQAVESCITLTSRKDNLRVAKKGVAFEFVVSSTEEGQTVITSTKITKEKAEKGLSGKILAFVQQHPNSTKTAVREAIKGRSTTVGDEVDRLIAIGTIQQDGGGRLSA